MKTLCRKMAREMAIDRLRKATRRKRDELGITDRAVEGRLGTMRQRYRNRMARLGLLPWLQQLEVIVSTPMAIQGAARGRVRDRQAPKKQRVRRTQHTPKSNRPSGRFHRQNWKASWRSGQAS